LLPSFERIDLCDAVTLIERKDRKFVVHCASPHVPVDRTNLCYKSAELLRRRMGARGAARGADIVIVKNIPVGAGLGGGSSNAAAALTGLNRLWGGGLKRGELAALAGEVGSDAAFFIWDIPFALGTGRGEVITPLSVPAALKLTHLLVVPRLHVSTPRMYKAWDAAHALAARLTIKSADDRLCARNDLEPLTLALYPEVGRIKLALRKMGLSSVLMSGSGPSVFALAASSRRAELLKKTLAREHGDWRVYVVQTK
jgi:4-diphosphocytidyl-2-C-methyl-D-erythritol kinase